MIATGIPGAVLWSADVAVAFLCGCPIVVISMLAGNLLIYVRSGSVAAVTAPVVLLGCFIAPEERTREGEFRLGGLGGGIGHLQKVG